MTGASLHGFRARKALPPRLLLAPQDGHRLRVAFTHLALELFLRGGPRVVVAVYQVRHQRVRRLPNPIGHRLYRPFLSVIPKPGRTGHWSPHSAIASWSLAIRPLLPVGEEGLRGRSLRSPRVRRPFSTSRTNSSGRQCSGRQCHKSSSFGFIVRPPSLVLPSATSVKLRRPRRPHRAKDRSCSRTLVVFTN